MQGWINPFKKGDRVAIRPGVKKQGSRHGVVACEPRSHNLVIIIWDGNRSPSSAYHIDLVEHAAPPRS